MLVKVNLSLFILICPAFIPNRTRDSLCFVSIQISVFVSGNLSFFTESRSDESDCDPAPSTVHPAVTELKQRAADYMSLISRVRAGAVNQSSLAVILPNLRLIY